MTGLRMHDALYPCAVGGTVALAGGGENASMVTWTLAKNVQADVSIYVGCGPPSGYAGDFRGRSASCRTQVGPERGPHEVHVAA